MNKKGLGNQAFSGVIWMSTGVVGQQIVQIIVLAVLARLLTPADFGIVTAAMVVMSVSTLFVEIGIAPALIQKNKLKTIHIETAYLLSLLFGIFFFAILQFLAPIIQQLFGIHGLKTIINVFAFSFIWMGAGMVSEALLARNLKFKTLARIRFLSYFGGYGITALSLSYYGFGYWSLVYANLAQSLISTVLLCLEYQPKLKFVYNKTAVKELMFLGGGFSLAKIINFSATRGDKVVAGKFLGAEALGLYGKAYELMVFPNKLYDQVVAKVALSALSKIQDDPSRLKEVYLRSVSITAFLGLPGTILIYLLGQDIVHTIFGDGWNDMVIPFKFLSLGIFFRLAYKVSNSLILSKGLVYQFALTQFAYSLAVLFGSYYGSIEGGLVLMTKFILMAIILNFVILTSYALYILKISPLRFITVQWQGALLAICLFIPISLINNYDLPSIVKLLLGLSLSGLFFILGGLIPRKYFIGKEIGWFVDKVLANFSKR